MWARNPFRTDWLDGVRLALWRHGRALELKGYDAEALWFYAWASWFPW